MNQKVVLITGASSGIGYATAEFLTSKNWIVFGCSRNAPKGNYSFRWLQMDITDQVLIEKGVKTVIEQAGRLDVIINNAGLGINGPLEDLPLENIEQIIETNLMGMIGTIKASLQYMRRQKTGLIINISSIAGSVGLPYRSIYCMSKFGVEGLTEALRYELKKFNIQVCSLQPGSISTDIKKRRLSFISDSSPYQPEIGKIDALSNSHVKNGLPAERVAEAIFRICTSKVVRPRYKVAKPMESLVPRIKNWIPFPIFEKLLMRHYKIDTDY
jgi:NAD(P)-dependent dehydrogenase (short-subunit alcohol dehydrogenase family)